VGVDALYSEGDGRPALRRVGRAVERVADGVKRGGTLAAGLNGGEALTDSMGRVVDFRNTIILLTSNVGAETLLIVGMERCHGEIVRPVEHSTAVAALYRLNCHYCYSHDDL
jgi:hypothetical protein